MKKANIIDSIIIDQICQKVRSLNDSLNLRFERSDVSATPWSVIFADLTLLPNDSTERRSFLLLLARIELLNCELELFYLCKTRLSPLLLTLLIRGDY